MIWKKYCLARWWLNCCILSFLLLTACSTISPPSTPISSGSPTGLTPTTPALSPVPESCLPGPVPQKVSSDIGLAIGGSPLWAAGFAGPHATIPIDPNAPYTANGWPVKILWAIEPDYMHPLMLQGTNLQTGAPIYFNVTGQTTRSPVLDPSIARTAPGKWADFPSNIFIPSAGCYSIEANLPGGQWRITFAAGSAP